MKRNVLWKIWTETSTEEKALKVFRRVLQKMSIQGQIISVEPYPKINGYIINFGSELESEKLNDQIIECFRIGQSVASSWSLTGNVVDDPGGWSSKSNVPGVNSIEWTFR